MGESHTNARKNAGKRHNSETSAGVVCSQTGTGCAGLLESGVVQNAHPKLDGNCVGCHKVILAAARSKGRK